VIVLKKIRKSDGGTSKCLATLSVPLIFKRVTGSNEELEELRKFKKKVETEFLGGEGFGDSQDYQ